MIKRPYPISVLGGIEILTGILSVVTLARGLVLGGAAADQQAQPSAVPASIEYLIGLIGAAVAVASGYYILAGRNWARWLCVGWVAAMLLFGIAASTPPVTLLPGVLFLLIAGWILFTPTANRFFAGGGLPAGVPVLPSWRTLLSVAFYFAAGIALGTSCLLASMALAEGLAMAKLFLIMFAVFPGAVLLAIGRLLSEDANWKREVGTVLTVSAVFGASAVLIVSSMNQAHGTDMVGDYWMAGFCTLGMLLIGVLLLHVAAREAKATRVHAPIPPFARR